MLRNYLKIALKVLQRRRFFTAISLFCISFTLIVLMAVAAMLDHLLAPMAPEVHQARSLRCKYMEMRGDESQRTGEPGYAFLDRYLRPMPGPEAVTIFSELNDAVTYLGDRKLVAAMRRTDGTYWRILRFEFLEGGPFGDDDDRAGRAVAVINAATRRRLFGDGAAALGRDVELDGQTFRIVGVVEDVPNYRQTAYADVWTPIGTIRSDRYRTELMGGFEAIVLAKKRADLPRLKAEFTALLPRVEMTHPETYKEMRGMLRTYPEQVATSLVPMRTDATTSRWRDFVVALVGAALLFMWLPAMNLVNINLSRILERSSEIGVRKAFGASSRALVWQFVLENIVLCLIGGALALVLSSLVLRAIDASGIVPYAHFSLNLRVFAIALGLAVFFGVLSGVYPAWRMSRLHPVLALRGGAS
jgi:putative ABC transport system permease protein